MKDLDINVDYILSKGKDLAIEKKECKSLIKKNVFLFMKRCSDVIVSALAFFPLIFLCFIIKIVNLCSGDKGPVIYTQYRIGLDGKPFKLYKFRTMVINADEVLKEMLKDKKYKNEWDKYHKFEDDPRITKAGKFLRKYSIDELPQLFNVLRGDMALIGNRPYLLTEKENMGEYYKNIIKSKPGITGLWQTSGRNDITFDRRCIIEAYYSCVYSVRLDLKIFFKTFRVVLFGRGAR